MLGNCPEFNSNQKMQARRAVGVLRAELSAAREREAGLAVRLADAEAAADFERTSRATLVRDMADRDLDLRALSNALTLRAWSSQ